MLYISTYETPLVHPECLVGTNCRVIFVIFLYIKFLYFYIPVILFGICILFTSNTLNKALMFYIQLVPELQTRGRIEQ